MGVKVLWVADVRAIIAFIDCHVYPHTLVMLLPSAAQQATLAGETRTYKYCYIIIIIIIRHAPSVLAAIVPTAAYPGPFQ